MKLLPKKIIPKENVELIFSPDSVIILPEEENKKVLSERIKTLWNQNKEKFEKAKNLIDNNYYLKNNYFSKEMLNEIVEFSKFLQPPDSNFLLEILRKHDVYNLLSPEIKDFGIAEKFGDEEKDGYIKHYCYPHSLIEKRFKTNLEFKEYKDDIGIDIRYDYVLLLKDEKTFVYFYQGYGYCDPRHHHRVYSQKIKPGKIRKEEYQVCPDDFSEIDSKDIIILNKSEFIYLLPDKNGQSNLCLNNKTLIPPKKNFTYGNKIVYLCKNKFVTSMFSQNKQLFDICEVKNGKIKNFSENTTCHDIGLRTRVPLNLFKRINDNSFSYSIESNGISNIYFINLNNGIITTDSYLSSIDAYNSSKLLSFMNKFFTTINIDEKLKKGITQFINENTIETDKTKLLNPTTKIFKRKELFKGKGINKLYLNDIIHKYE